MISGPINIVGNHVESQGTYVTRIKNTNRTPTNGAAAFTTWAKLIPVMPEVTNKFIVKDIIDNKEKNFNEKGKKIKNKKIKNNPFSY